MARYDSLLAAVGDTPLVGLPNLSPAPDVRLVGAGFAAVELDRYRMRSLFLPVNEQVAGVVTA